MLAPGGSFDAATLEAARGVRWPGASRRAGLLGGVALLAAACSLVLVLAPSRPAAGTHRSRAAVPGHSHAARELSLTQLPLSAQGPISGTLGADDPTYRVWPAGARLHAASPAQRLNESFERSGAWVGSGTTVVGLRLRSVGFGRVQEALAPTDPQARANGVTYSWPGLSEWYRNGPVGLEQGFTIRRAPAGRRDGPLTVSLSLSGGARATLGHGGRSVVLRHAGGPTLRYGGLQASDANGRVLRSWLELRGGRLLVRANAQGARFPVQIDPFIQQGEKLVGTGQSGPLTTRLGFSVALSSGGNTALIGGPGDYGGTGAAWVFTRSGSTWTQQGSKLTASGELGEGRFGSSVAISANGTTALIGAPRDNNGAGAAWVFTSSGTTWSQQGSKLIGGGEVSSEAAPGEFGQGVALGSSEGNTALIGGPGDAKGTGAAWAFTRSEGKWTQQGPKLTGAEEITSAEAPGKFGFSVSLGSTEGSAAFVGGPGDGKGTGAAWAFARSGSTWTQQGVKLTGSGEVTSTESPGEFGYSVALGSTEGSFALVGGPGDGKGAGAAWAFGRSGSTWTQQGSKLTGSGELTSELAPGEFGFSVALSASEGNTALVGGPGDSKGTGAAWPFTRSGSAWTLQGSKLTGTGEVSSEEAPGEVGSAVSLSANGSTALVGGLGDAAETGASWVFTRSGSMWTEQGPKLTGTGASARSRGSIGTSVALSSDGNTALVGGPNDGPGAAWVFTRSGSSWAQQGPKLTGGEEVGETVRFGGSVALSSDGNTALIGGSGDNGNAGAAWVFTREGTTWKQQGAKLTGSGASGASRLGTSVALSSNGNTALAGGPYDNVEAGAAWVFTREGTTWKQQGPKLTGTGASAPSRQGHSVALSSDGNTALLGAPYDTGEVGAAWVFTRSGSTWTQQGPKLTASGGGGALPPKFGEAVALSSDGGTALIGAPLNEDGEGAGWVFTRSGSTWTQQAKITGGEQVGIFGGFGSSVALGAEGNIALVGGPLDNGEAGAVWTFIRSAGAWSQHGPKITATGESGGAQLGSSVALSSSGGTALVGGASDYGGTGAAWVFVQQPPGVETTAATSITYEGATLNGAVNPEGAQVSECKFEYGTTTSYGSSVPCSSSPGSGESPVSVSAAVTGLTPSTTYHFRISATNTGGASTGGDATFKTLPPPPPPTVLTKAAWSVRTTTALLNATVNPNGGRVTECKFEYGTTTSYGSSVACSPSPGSGETAVAVSGSVSGLSASTTYHYRVVATNAGGTGSGSDMEFTTTPTPVARHWYRGGGKVVAGVKVPLVFWGGPTNISFTSSAGEVSCKTVGAGSAENPAGGGTGVGEVLAYMMYECKAPQCEALVKEKFGAAGRGGVGGENLPWHGELFEGGSPAYGRLRIGETFAPPFGSPKAGEMKLKMICEVVSTHTVVSSTAFEGETQPEIGSAAENVNGVSAAKPSVTRFAGPSTGTLYSETAGEGSLTGILKYLGYTSQEVAGVQE
jgi:hypothetical protein